MIIDKKFLTENGIDQSSLLFERLISDKKAEQLFCDIVSAYTGDSKLRIAEIRSAVLLFLLYLCKNHFSRADKSAKSALPDKESFRRIHEAISYIKSNLAKRITVDDIAAQVHISKFHFLRQFKEITGETVINYVRFLRCENAKILLSSGEHTVAETAMLVGFENASYFTATFKHYIGMTPREYLKTHRN